MNAAQPHSFLARILLFCGAFDRSAVKHCSRHEQLRCEIIGASVIFTALFASFSFGYAIWTTFEPAEHAIPLAALLGTVWGLMIFNLDRFIVSSMVKLRNAGRYKSMLLFSPRLALAVLLGITVAVPLELKIFEEEIEQYLNAQKRQQILGIQEDTDTKVQQIRTAHKGKITELQEQLEVTKKSHETQSTQFDASITDLQTDVNRLYEELKRENSGEGISGEEGRGPEWRLLREQYDRAVEKLRTEKEKLAPLRTLLVASQKSALDDLKKQREDIEKDRETAIQRVQLEGRQLIREIERRPANTILSRWTALMDIKKTGNFFPTAHATPPNATPSSNDQVAQLRSEAVGIMITFVMLLFITVELSPALIKVLAPRGDYDILISTDRDRRVNHETRHTREEAIADMASVDRHEEAASNFNLRKKIRHSLLDGANDFSGTLQEQIAEVVRRWKESNAVSQAQNYATQVSNLFKGMFDTVVSSVQRSYAVSIGFQQAEAAQPSQPSGVHRAASADPAVSVEGERAQGASRGDDSTPDARTNGDTEPAAIEPAGATIDEERLPAAVTWSIRIGAFLATLLAVEYAMTHFGNANIEELGVVAAIISVALSLPWKRSETGGKA